MGGDDMLKNRFVCSNKEMIINKIEDMMIRDYPVKSIWGINLYRSGIHFQECGEIIKGFYLDEGEDETIHGSPIRVCFFGKFIEDAGNLFFDVYIYPNIFEAVFFIFAFVFACVYGGIAGFMVASLVLFFFAKGYYDMMNDTYRILDRIFK